MRAIILAGGKGTRLRPYTTIIPKALVPIGDKMPILEVVIRQLAAQGYTHITMTVNHLANLIMAFFEDGSKWGIKIDYSLEDRPLSTIGPLTLINDLPENFLVMNGDILTNLNYKQFMETHIQQQSEVSVALYKREAKIDFGVIQYDSSNHMITFVEKPSYNFDVSMGIYCINRKTVENLQPGEPYGFDNLMLDRLKNHESTVVYPFDGFWLDIGRPEDYDHVNENYEEISKVLSI